MTAYFLWYVIVSFQKFCAIISCFAYIVVLFLVEHVSPVIFLIFKISQEYEGDFKPSISASYIPNDMKGNLTYKFYSRRLVDAMIVFVLNVAINYFSRLSVFTFFSY